MDLLSFISDSLPHQLFVMSFSIKRNGDDSYMTTHGLVVLVTFLPALAFTGMKKDMFARNLVNFQRHCNQLTRRCSRFVLESSRPSNDTAATYGITFYEQYTGLTLDKLRNGIISQKDGVTNIDFSYEHPTLLRLNIPSGNGLGVLAISVL